MLILFLGLDTRTIVVLEGVAAGEQLSSGCDYGGLHLVSEHTERRLHSGKVTSTNTEAESFTWLPAVRLETIRFHKLRVCGPTTRGRQSIAQHIRQTASTN